MRQLPLAAVVASVLPFTLGSSCWDTDAGGAGSHACELTQHALTRNVDISLSHEEPGSCPVRIQYAQTLQSGAQEDELTRPVEADFSTGYVYSQPDWGQQGYFVDSFRYDLWGDYYAQPYVYYQAGMGTDSYDEGV